MNGCVVAEMSTAVCSAVRRVNNKQEKKKDGKPTTEAETTLLSLRRRREAPVISQPGTVETVEGAVLVQVLLWWWFARRTRAAVLRGGCGSVAAVSVLCSGAGRTGMELAKLRDSRFVDHSRLAQTGHRGLVHQRHPKRPVCERMWRDSSEDGSCGTLSVQVPTTSDTRAGRVCFRPCGGGHAAASRTEPALSL